MAEDDDRMYHERQRLQLCLLHALNNLVQGEESIKFTRKELDAIADGLSNDGVELKSWSWSRWAHNHHRNVFTGNYDANVLLAALASRGMDGSWYDKRRGGVVLPGEGAPLVGVIANVTAVRWAGLWKGRHWIAVRQLGGAWYNFDSDLTAPLVLGDDQAASRFLDDLLASGGEIFLITRNDK